MKKNRFISAITAIATSVTAVSLLPFIPSETYAADVVYNDFERSYGGWYGNTDNVTLTAEDGAGYNGTRGMRVTDRNSSDDGASSSKGLYLSGGMEYDYNVMVYSDSAEEFNVSLMYIDEETEKKTTVELVSENVKAGSWTKLSAEFEAPSGTYEYLLTITTDSTCDFAFDDVRITTEKPENIVYAADSCPEITDTLHKKQSVRTFYPDALIFILFYV